MFNQANFQSESRKRRRETVAKVNAKINQKINDYMEQHREEIENGFREDGQSDSEIEESLEILRRRLQVTFIKQFKEIRQELIKKRKGELGTKSQTEAVESKVLSQTHHLGLKI